MATESSTAQAKTYSGSCHCGLIRYSATLDLTDPVATKCNCSICLKKNFLSLRIDQNSFKLLSPSSLDQVGDYLFSSKSMHHYFCKICGIHCFGKGKYELQGKEVEHMSINAVTLDQEQGIDLRKFKVQYWDGKNDNWAKGLKDEPFDGGCY